MWRVKQINQSNMVTKGMPSQTSQLSLVWIEHTAQRPQRCDLTTNRQRRYFSDIVVYYDVFKIFKPILIIITFNILSRTPTTRSVAHFIFSHFRLQRYFRKSHLSCEQEPEERLTLLKRNSSRYICCTFALNDIAILNSTEFRTPPPTILRRIFCSTLSCLLPRMLTFYAH